MLRAPQVADGLKKGNDDKLGMRPWIAEHAVHEPALFLKDERFEDIADCLGVADDVLADGALAVRFTKLASGIKDHKLARRCRRIDDARDAKRARILQHIQERALLLLFIEIAIIAHDPGRGEQLSDNLFMDI